MLGPLLVRGATRKPSAWRLLVRPHMRRRDRHADVNILPRHVEHHQVLSERKRTIVVLPDFAFDVHAGVEIVEEVVDDGKARPDQRKHLSESRRLASTIQSAASFPPGTAVFRRSAEGLIVNDLTLPSPFS